MRRAVHAVGLWRLLDVLRWAGPAQGGRRSPQPGWLDAPCSEQGQPLFIVQRASVVSTGALWGRVSFEGLPLTIFGW